MPSTNGFSSDLARIVARIDWLMHRLEVIDARLVALEVRAARAGKRPPSRAAQLANLPDEKLRSRSTARASRKPRRR